MGNRGKGKKGGKRGNKGRNSAKPSNKWGDEDVSREEVKPVRKKLRISQESQDRERRIRLRGLAKAKDFEKTERLSRPNRMPAAPRSEGQKSGKKRKRKRSVASGRRLDRKRETAYSSSSDDENPMSWDTETQPGGGFDVGLAGYKKLLSTLTRSGAMIPSLDEDKDLADAVMTRRIQTQGGDDAFGSESSVTDDEDIVGEEFEDGSKLERDGDEDGELREENGEHTADSEDTQEDGGEAGPRTGVDNAKEDTTMAEDSRDEADEEMIANGEANLESDDEDEDEAILPTSTGENRRSRDELCRHFISTPVFPPEQAEELLSDSARPSFKPLATGRRQWESVGITISASEKASEVVPGPLPSEASLSQQLRVLPSLADRWEQFNHGPPSKLQSLLLPSMVGYRDMVCYSWRDEEADEIRKSYVLHALNHALTSRRRVLRHTARLRKTVEEARLAAALGSSNQGVSGDGVPAAEGDSQTNVEKRKAGGTLETESPSPLGTARDEPTAAEDWQRDQGFTRPKVLILAPFRAAAYELMELMLELLGPKTVVANRDRFDKEYGPEDEDADEGEGDDERARRDKAVSERKPADWKALFGQGRNMDDMFTLGVSVSPGGGKGKPGEGRGVGVRLYCDFYNSDIIIASPVALHRVAVPTAEDGDGHDPESPDSDFLSSVELMILDRADVFLMQNWAYVPEIAEVVNTRPTGERAGRVDFSRVRSLFLHDQGRLFRQTLIFSAYQDPNINALVARHCRNHDGVLKLCRPSGDGHICSVVVQAKQVFQRIPADSPAAQHEARFQYFVDTVLPQMVRAKQSHTAVFIPSYFDYVRLRNHLMKEKTSFVSVHEYSRVSEVSRSRSRFFRGERDLMLYTGRAHFFNRFAIRGIHHLIFYSLPECPQFYPEMVNLLEEAESVTAVTCLALFTKFERLSLERIVGSERAQHMLRSSKNTFLFC